MPKRVATVPCYRTELGLLRKVESCRVYVCSPHLCGGQLGKEIVYLMPRESLSLSLCLWSFCLLCIIILTFALLEVEPYSRVHEV